MLYAQRCNNPWVDFADPGPHCTIDPAMNTAGQSNLLVNWTYKKGVYNSEQNIKAATITGLNKAVPPKYRRMANAVGTREFCITDSPLDIMNQLQTMYGELLLTKKMNMEIYGTRCGIHKPR